MAKLTSEKIEELSRECGSFLATNEKRPTTKGGRALVHAFWLGALSALDQRDHTYILLCLITGRHSDICTQGETP
jgi:hypothetical protein